MKPTTNTSTTSTTGHRHANATQLQQQLDRAHQTAALGEQLFARAQAHTAAPSLHQRARTTFVFQHGPSRRATTTVEAVAPDEVSLTAKRLTVAQAGTVLATLLPERAPESPAAEPTNADRAGWAEEAADAFASMTWGGETFRSVAHEEPAYVLSDLLASMMHLAAAEGLDWDEIVTRATMHWQAEAAQARADEAPVATQPMQGHLSQRLTEQEYTHQRAMLLAQKAACEADARYQHPMYRRL